MRSLIIPAALSLTLSTTCLSADAWTRAGLGSGTETEAGTISSRGFARAVSRQNDSSALALGINPESVAYSSSAAFRLTDGTAHGTTFSMRIGPQSGQLAVGGIRALGRNPDISAASRVSCSGPSADVLGIGQFAAGQTISVDSPRTLPPPRLPAHHLPVWSEQLRIP